MQLKILGRIGIFQTIQLFSFKYVFLGNVGFLILEVLRYNAVPTFKHEESVLTEKTKREVDVRLSKAPRLPDFEIKMVSQWVLTSVATVLKFFSV